jgi:hypothetical protein
MNVMITKQVNVNIQNLYPGFIIYLFFTFLFI